MGWLKKFNRSMKADRAKTRAVKLSKQLGEFYGTHLVSPWQRQRVDSIRKLFEEKEKALNVAHDHAVSRVAEEFMEFELHYLRASNEFKKTNPGEKMEFKTSGGLFARAFMVNLIKKAKSLNFNYGSKEKNNVKV